MLESAGAQILTCHGCIREQRGQNSGLADRSKIRAVKEAVSVPVFANGNILYHWDIERYLRETGADAVMSAEGQLYDPALFSRACEHEEADGKGRMMTFDEGLHLPHADLALEYLDIVQSLKTRTALSAVKGHLFKIMRPALAHEPDLRKQLSKISGPDGIVRYVEVAREMQSRMKVHVLFCPVMQHINGLALFMWLHSGMQSRQRIGVSRSLLPLSLQQDLKSSLTGLRSRTSAR